MPDKTTFRFHGFPEQDKPALWDILWENAIGGIAIVHEDGTFLRANPAFCRIVEYSELELQEMSFADITMPGDRSIDQELAAEVADGKRETYDMVKSYLTKTRRPVWVHLRVVAYRINGKFTYFLSQVFEMPTSVVTQMGLDAYKGVTYRLEAVEAKKAKTVNVNWEPFLKWAPLVISAFTAALIGGLWLIGIAVPALPGS